MNIIKRLLRSFIYLSFLEKRWIWEKIESIAVLTIFFSSSSYFSVVGDLTQPRLLASSSSSTSSVVSSSSTIVPAAPQSLSSLSSSRALEARPSPSRMHLESISYPHPHPHPHQTHLYTGDTGCGGGHLPSSPPVQSSDRHLSTQWATFEFGGTLVV